MYLFSDNASDSSVSDCFFDVSDVSTAPVAVKPEAKQFPRMLGPFGLAPSLLGCQPDLDAQRGTFCVDSVQVFESDGAVVNNPQLQKLKEFGLLPLTGKVSPMYSVTLTEGARRQAMIPKTATNFVYAYQCVDSFTQEQTQALEDEEMTDSDDISFVTLGGFIYLDSNNVPVGV